jgi:hypothetical protein
MELSSFHNLACSKYVNFILISFFSVHSSTATANFINNHKNQGLFDAADDCYYVYMEIYQKDSILPLKILWFLAVLSGYKAKFNNSIS